MKNRANRSTFKHLNVTISFWLFADSKCDPGKGLKHRDTI